jgi:hypothetical protein
MRTKVTMLAALVALMPAVASASVFSTGFEVPDYATGVLEPQQGWSASGTNLPWASVSRLNPFAGQQHLRVVRDTTVSQGTGRLAFSPSFGVQPAGTYEVSMQINISNDQGADYSVIGQAPSQSLLTWRVLLSFSDALGTGPGTIFVLDDLGTGLGFVDTGDLWTPGVYKELKVVSDAVADTIEYYYGGSLIYTSVAGVFAGTSVEQVVIFNDNFQLGGETADFDNLSVTLIPEPASLGLLAGLAPMALRRRRA